MATNETKKRVRGVRLTPTERIARLEAQIRAEKAKVAAETMADDPVAGQVIRVIARLDERMRIAKRTINGHGKGKGISALDKAERLRREADDLEMAYNRDTALMLDADDFMSRLETYRDGILEGEIDPHNSEFPSVPDSYKGYTETETERIARIEREAAREQNITCDATRDDDENDDESETETVDSSNIEIDENVEVTES